MSEPTPLSQAVEDRVADLATGFALGELTDTELDELYNLLRQPGTQGDQTARVAWQALTTAVDLRAAVSTRFEDTLRHRLSTQKAGAERDTFLGRVAARLGFARARLEEVQPPSEGEVRLPYWRMPWVWLLVIIILPIIAWLVITHWPHRQIQVQITRLRGMATVEGRTLRVGGQLDRRPVIVAPDSAMVIVWPQGHTAAVAGAATVVAHETGLSLSSGMVWLRIQGPFTLGLPDGQVRTEAASEIALQITGGRSLLGVKDGQVSLVSAKSGRRRHLNAGQAAATEGKTFPWVQTPAWEPETRSEAGTRVRHLRCAQETAAWEFQALLQFTDLQEACHLLGRGEQEAEGGIEEAPADRIQFQPGVMVLYAANEEPQRFELRGAPLLARRIRLRALPGERAVLRVDGCDNALPVPFRGPLGAIQLSGKAHLKAVRFRTGPPTWPADLR